MSMPFFSRLPVIATILVSFFGGGAVARDPVGAAEDPQALTLRDCRIQLLQRAVLGCEQSGVLGVVAVQDGDVVEPGQLLARVRDQLARATLQSAAARASNDVELRYAEKVSELARLEYAGALELNQEITGAHPETQIRKLHVAAQRAALQLEQATHQLEMAKIEKDQAAIALESFSVKSPFQGVVLKVHKVEGESVQAGEPIVEIGNPGLFRVEGFLPLESAWHVKRGHAVVIRVEIPGVDLEVEKHIFRGEIVFVDSEIQDVSRQVRVWARVEDSRGLLKSGLTATMQISPVAQIADRLKPRN